MTNGRAALLDSPEAARRPLHPGHPARPDVGVRGAAHPRVPRRDGRRSACCGAGTPWACTTLNRSRDSSRLTDNTADDADADRPGDRGLPAGGHAHPHDARHGRARDRTASPTAKGRKSVILVSEGFIEDYNLPDYKRVNTASRRANAAIYFVNARGLDAMPVGMTRPVRPGPAGRGHGRLLRRGARRGRGAPTGSRSDSGGFAVRNMNDLGQGHPEDRERDAGLLPARLHPLERGPRRQVPQDPGEARPRQEQGPAGARPQGLLRPERRRQAALAEQRRGIDPVFQAALDSPWVQDGIPLRMTDYVGDEKMLGKAAVRLTAEVDPRSVQFEEKDGRSSAELDFLMVVAHRQTGEYFRYDQTYNLKLLPTTRERLTRQWMPIVRDFELAPGDYQAKVIVRDKRSGRVGSLMHEFEVPRARSVPHLDAGAERHAGGDADRGGRAGRQASRRSRAASSAAARRCSASSRSTGPRRTTRRACRACWGVRRQAPRRQRAHRMGSEHDQADVARPPLPDVRLPAGRRATRGVRPDAGRARRAERHDHRAARAVHRRAGVRLRGGPRAGCRRDDGQARREDGNDTRGSRGGSGCSGRGDGYAVRRRRRRSRRGRKKRRIAGARTAPG